MKDCKIFKSFSHSGTLSRIIHGWDNAPQGCYLLQVSFGHAYAETVIIIEKNEITTHRLLIIAKFLPFKKRLGKDKVEELVDKFRMDHVACLECKKKYEDYRDKFQCSYCKKRFCTLHRIPERHNCEGNPRQVPGGLRELFSKGGMRATGVGEPR
ncbi:MAG: AN1-type zinc finger domain-containing protein [Candidatus Aenigmarchaeota archaeon]|nr:AN1-type zinc finger domain-containing protein [Candidatus Aenigmarchaeota archaeon]